MADVLGQPAGDLLGKNIFSLLPGGDKGPPSPALIETDPTSPVGLLRFRPSLCHHRRDRSSGGVPPAQDVKKIRKSDRGRVHHIRPSGQR